MPFGRKTNPNAPTIHCEVCKKEVNPNAKNVARAVVGWLAPRSGGGPNHIRFQSDTGQYAHVACLSELHEPVKANQGELF